MVIGPLPHEDCPLCHRLVGSRRERIADFNRTIEWTEDEITEIERGMRHTAFHEAYRRDGNR